MKNSFAYSDTLVAKGIAITLMVVHHLFAFPSRIPATSYFSILPFQISEHPVEYYIASFGEICVATFVFLSGYGMYKSLSLKPKNPVAYAWQKCLGFYRIYWTCFAVFIPIGLLFYSNQERYRFSWSELILNFVGLSDSYNGEWWFVDVYIFLLIIFAIIIYLIRRSVYWLLAISFTGYAFSFILPFNTELLSLQFSFVLGVVFAHSNLYEKFPDFFKSTFLQSFLACIVLFFLRASIFESKEKFDALLVPFFAYYSVSFVLPITSQERLKRTLKSFGKYSGYIWLTHTFFCYYYFQNIVLLPKLSIFIVAWLLAISFCFSVFLSLLEKAAFSFVCRSKSLKY